MTNFQDIFTPDILTQELLSYIPIKSGDKILEPTCGDGNMVNILLDTGKNIKIDAIEIQGKHIRTMINRLKNRKGVKVKIQEPSVTAFDVFFGKN